MFCHQCGKQIAVGLHICPHCGETVLDDDTDNEDLNVPQKGVETGFFKGRITRRNWWRVTLISWGVFLLGMPLVILIARDLSSWTVFEIFLTYLIVGMIVVQLCTWSANVKRFHDINQSGWILVVYYVVSLVPIFSLYYVVSVPIFSLVAWILEIYQLGCQDGTMGINNYGPDPKGRNR